MQQASVNEKRTSAQAAAPASQTTTSTSQHKYSKEVEQIVAEERDAKSKLPRYKGLERFELLEKMGECVPGRLQHAEAPMLTRVDLQRRFLERIQSRGYRDGPESGRYVMARIDAGRWLTSRSSQGRPQVRAHVLAG